MPIPYFVADSARVTILRPLASSAFGSYNLSLPEGIDLEDVHDFEAPGNELGHVATLTRSRRVGGLARRFVRADVAVSAADPSDPDLIPDSNVDAVLSEAAARVASEFFLESNITKAGLGPWVPFVDFKVGDKARVNIWGHVVTLPITRIEPIISDHDVVDWLVHLGGQLVSDDDAREVENENLRKAFLQDRRELAGIEGQVKAVDKKAEDAKSAADTAKGTADDALAAATDADGVIQGHVNAAAAASQAAHESSQASLGHSVTAGAHSEAAGAHSADASAASVTASGHSVTAAGHADTAAGHSADASLASQTAAGHSVTAAGHSTDASLASQEARDASTTAAGYSGSAWDYSQLADQAALAAGGSEADAAEWKRLAEVARSLAEQERDAAETARADAEDARDAAEVSRSAAESGRADAEAARDRAEQARYRSMASMAAAEMMRAQAEEARRLAEDARALAEDSRADAEDARKDAEAARSLAEGHRDNAFTYMSNAFDEWEKAEDERESAWEAHQAVVGQNSLNIDQLEKQLVGMREELERVRGNLWTPLGLGMNESSGGFTTSTATDTNRFTLSVSGSWVGRVIITVMYTTRASLNDPLYEAQAVYTRDIGVNRSFEIVLQNGWDRPKFVSLQYRRDAKTVWRNNIAPRDVTITSGQWTTIHSVYNTKSAEGIASMRVGWHRTTFDNNYGIRIRVGGTATSGGTVVASDGPRNGVGPLTILGNGYRVMAVSNQSYVIPAGATVRMEAYTNATGQDQRTIRDATLNMAWIDD